MIPSGHDFTVSVSPPRKDSDPWQDGAGNWWTPGQVTPGGSIVSATPGQFITDGVVWVPADQIESAERCGWTRNGVTEPEGIVQVRLDPDRPSFVVTNYGLCPGDPDDRGMAARILSRT